MQILVLYAHATAASVQLHQDGPQPRVAECGFCPPDDFGLRTFNIDLDHCRNPAGQELGEWRYRDKARLCRIIGRVRENVIGGSPSTGKTHLAGASASNHRMYSHLVIDTVQPNVVGQRTQRISAGFDRNSFGADHR